MELNTIYNEDCLLGMQRIPDGSIDCIICDLPYGVLNRNNPSASWDNVIPPELLWEQYRRVIKRNGAILLFGQGMFTAQMMASQPTLWRYNLVWDKVRKTGFLNSNHMPLRQHEDIMVFYSEQPTYNPQMIPCLPHQRNHSKGMMLNQNQNRCYGSYVATPTKESDEKFPTSIISIQKPHKNGAWHHPTEKPVALVEYLIRTYTNEAETILDNCMGGGTTAIACINTGRNYVGFEINKEYYDIAQKRIKLHLEQPKLFHL